jgi:hypothetical protein
VKTGTVIKCSLCGVAGHNRMSCQAKQKPSVRVLAPGVSGRDWVEDEGELAASTAKPHKKWGKPQTPKASVKPRVVEAPAEPASQSVPLTIRLRVRVVVELAD